MHYFERSITPPPNRNLVAYCPDWCDESYVVCTYDETGFNYSGQQSNDFDKYVTHYGFLFEFE